MLLRRLKLLYFSFEEAGVELLDALISFNCAVGKMILVAVVLLVILPVWTAFELVFGGSE